MPSFLSYFDLTDDTFTKVATTHISHYLLGIITQLSTESEYLIWPVMHWWVSPLHTFLDLGNDCVEVIIMDIFTNKQNF